MPDSKPPVISIVIATRNDHKAREIRAILGEGFHCRSLKEFPDAPPVIENADTFAGNAAKKALELARWLDSKFKAQYPKPDFVLADDSGLEVDALGGVPGVHSARFAALDSGAAGNSSDPENVTKLLRLLEGVPAERRTARFRCVIALVAINPQSAIRNPQLFDGACEGRIGPVRIGTGGFGYDPVFTPDGFDLTFAELGDAVKNGMSHRARALDRLKESFSRRA